MKFARSKIFTEAKGDRPDASNIIIVITDGDSNVNSGRTIPEANEARNAGIRVFVLGIGLVSGREMDGMASRPLPVNRFHIGDFTEMEQVKRGLITGICQGISNDLFFA